MSERPQWDQISGPLDISEKKVQFLAETATYVVEEYV